MRCLYLFFFLLGLFFNANAQYHISYKNEYFKVEEGIEKPVNPGVSEHIYQDYFVMDGKYKSVISGGPNLIEMYSAEKNERSVINIHGDINTFKAVLDPTGDRVKKITPLGTTKEIMGYLCKSLQVDFGKYKIQYFYSDQIKINPESFNQHSYMDWNKIVAAMNGSVPLQFIVEIGSLKSVSTALSVSKIEADELKYSPKASLKLHEKEMAEKFSPIAKRLLQNKANALEINSFEASGNAVMNQFKLPLKLQFKSPISMIFSMSVNGVNFYFSYTKEQQWEYNPIDDKVTVKQNNDEANDGSDNELLGAFNPVLKSDWNTYTPLGICKVDNTLFLLLLKDFMLEQYILDAETLLISVWGNENSNYYLEDYVFNQNTPFPRHIIQRNLLEEEPSFEAYFDEVNFNLEFSDSIFNIPLALRDKITVEEKAEAILATDKDYFEQGEHFSENKNYDSAIVNYKKAINLNSANKLYHNQLGVALLEKKDYYLALASFAKALEINPDYATARGNLGVTKMSLGDYKNAIEDFAMAIKLDSTSRNHTNNRGICYFKLEKFDLAQLDFERTVEIDSTYGIAFWNLAMSQYNQSNYSEATGNFSSALSLGHNNAEAYNYRGICYYREKQFEKALVDFKEATEFDEPLVNYFGNLGNTYVELGDNKMAIKAYESGIKLDSAYDKGYNNIGLIYFKEESYSAAISAFTRAIQINPNDPVYFDNRANSRISKMDYVGAIEDFSESINLYPKDANIFYQRGMAKIRINDKFDACKDLKKAMEMGSEEAKEAMAEHCQ